MRTALIAAERACLLNLTLHGILQDRGDVDLSRLAWVAYLESSAAATVAGSALGLTAMTDLDWASLPAVQKEIRGNVHLTP